MGILEEGFERLHWPPLVREVIVTVEYPGYRYEFFRSFGELDSYFSRQYGAEWRKEPWAEYWMNQHKETQREDRKDADPRQRKSTGPRKDAVQLYEIACAYIKTQTAPVSSRQLSRYFKIEHGITITPMTTWRMIKKYHNERR